jgi:RNA polymerase sigma-70 factor (ECF subfamily)
MVAALYPVVIRVVRNHLPTRLDEEDVAQEIFMKIFAKLDQYRGDAPLEHWVSRLSSTTCIDLLRRQKARPEVRFADLSSAEELLLEQRQSRDLGEESQESSLESQEVVDGLLSNLKPNMQLVLRLMDVEQKSVLEVCEITGWGASKVKVTAMRARRKLAEILGG